MAVDTVNGSGVNQAAVQNRPQPQRRPEGAGAEQQVQDAQLQAQTAQLQAQSTQQQAEAARIKSESSPPPNRGQNLDIRA